MDAAGLAFLRDIYRKRGLHPFINMTHGDCQAVRCPATNVERYELGSKLLAGTATGTIGDTTEPFGCEVCLAALPVVNDFPEVKPA